ncbi:hypothetical protein CIHG_01953 [Coccidioides immitis H538.4]|uniref:Alcohol acetyltransferase n=1 Tax=Coccidioides immitis H538.4 TaxID=396776 RepID=A0A0J8UAS4_COCIT|nr:hypothetical protein CIHG_01953 [Coccidioides immitis H538.4]
MPDIVSPPVQLHKLEKLRRVGLLEKYSTTRHHLGFYHNVSVSAAYTLPQSPEYPLKDCIYHASRALINEHPALSAVPVDEDTSKPYFVRLPEIDLAKSIFFDDWGCSFAPDGDNQDGEFPVESWDHKLEQFLQSQHDTPFTPGLPFWRLYILADYHDERHFVAVFVYHHGIGDGSSGKAFHATLLRALADAPSGGSKHPELVVKPPETPLLPALESLHPLPYSLPFLLKAGLDAKLPCRRDPRLWTGGKIRLPLRTKVRIMTVSESTTTILKQLCREHGTTITAALQTLLASALFAYLPRTYTKLHCAGAVSARRWLPRDVVTDNSMGVWVLDFSEMYTRAAVTESGSGFPWNEVQRSRKNIEHFLRRRGKNSQVALLRYVSNYHRDLCTSMIGKDRDASFEVSNLGCFKPTSSPQGLQLDENKSTDDKVCEMNGPRIGKMVFSQCANVAACAVNLSVITGGDGRLVLMFCWQESIVEPELMASVVEQMQKDISRLVKDAH